MKKIIYAIILIVMIFTFCGCPDKNKGNQDNKVEVKNKIDKKAAKEFMDNYLRTLTTGDINALNSFYSSNMKSEMKSAVKVLNPHVTGYKIETEGGSDESEGESEKSGGDDGKESTVEYMVHIFNAYTGFPYSSDDSVLYTLKIENKKMVIDKKKIINTVDVYSLNNALYKRSEGKVKGEYVVSIIDMPEFAIPQSTLPLEVKFSVPRDAFGPCVLAPDGSSIAISSNGANSFAAIVKTEEKGKSSSEESKAAMGGGQETGAGSSKTSGEENKETGKTGEESKLNTKLKPVDLYVGSKICNFAFSPDSKTLAVETIPDYGNNKIYLYKTKEQEIINAGIDKQFKSDRFKVMSPCFLSENELEFKVSAVKSATSDELRYNGFWIFNIKTKKFKQL